MKRVLILFGGKSAEHEVSIRSARNVLAALDRTQFEPVLVGIDREGSWHEVAEHDLPAIKGRLTGLNLAALGRIDVAFPILHGPLGEDGSAQGMLRLAGIPFVGPGVLGSAVNMDKDVEKRLLREAGLPVARYLACTPRTVKPYDEVSAELGATLFIKPANMGSSVGISKATNAAEYHEAMRTAFLYDRKVVVEEFVPGRELECGVLGNDDPHASAVGEIIPQAGFYSYEAKYLDENGALLSIPADLTEAASEEIRRLAVAAFQATGCEGMARVDFFLREDGTPVINELNTIPGFTSISMYPKLWEACGIPYSGLISRLLELAIERGDEETRLISEYRPASPPS